jgi:hypothetical protein
MTVKIRKMLIKKTRRKMIVKILIIAHILIMVEIAMIMVVTGTGDMVVTVAGMIIGVAHVGHPLTDIGIIENIGNHQIRKVSCYIKALLISSSIVFLSHE